MGTPNIKGELLLEAFEGQGYRLIWHFIPPASKITKSWVPFVDSSKLQHFLPPWYEHGANPQM